MKTVWYIRIGDRSLTSFESFLPAMEFYNKKKGLHPSLNVFIWSETVITR